MEYYHILNFKKEPFSNSPEPDFLFQSPQHTTCLQMLELAVRLRRGLNVVIGDVGTGKTTLCRKLIQNFSFAAADSPEIETHLLLDPALASTQEFLQTVALLLGIKDFDAQQSDWHLKERIKNYLFNKGVDEEKIVVLIIDEGQKIPEDCLEVLREFLNYETNNLKLLQIIIFAQKEFREKLKKHNNLSDRVNFLYYLKPLNFRQMRAMINYRISLARESEIPQALFSFGGLALIYAATRGYPRKVVSLCHQVILMLIIRGKKKAGFLLVKNSISEMAKPLFIRAQLALLSFLIVIALGLSIRAIILQGQNNNAYKQLPTTQIVPVPIMKTNSLPDSSIIQEDKKQDNKMPDYIGMLTVKKRMTLSWLLRNIYGAAYSGALEAVIKANPHIKNKDIIKEGDIITLPAIAADVHPVKNDVFIILLKQGKDIEMMYDFFRDNCYRKNMPPIVFFPFWNKKEEGVTFAVVIDKIFNNSLEAQKAIKKLPPAVIANTKILPGWGADTVIFSSHVFQVNE